MQTPPLPANLSRYVPIANVQRTATHIAQRFAQLAKTIPVHNAQGINAAKFLPPRDHFLEGFSFIEDSQFPLRRRVR
jgi:hypothetical protein